MKYNSKMFLLAALLGLSSALAAPAMADNTATVRGAGSSFAKPLYEKWMSRIPGVAYDSVGSAVGVNRFQNQVVDFGGSDVPMNDEQVAATLGDSSDVIQIPTAYGGIVVTYNVPGLKSLNLSGDVLAQIYTGQIRMWNDPRLVAANPGLANVNYPIITFHRGDGSGTTYGFTSYLAATSKDWKTAAFATIWPVGDGRGGNGPVVDAVVANPYSLGYADYNFVVAKKLPMAAIRNTSGTYVQPTLESIREAVANSVSGNTSDLRLNLIDAAGAKSYPLVTGTYIMVHRNQPDQAHADKVKEFLNFGLHEGQAEEAALNYVPLPDNVVAAASKLVNTITVKK